MDKNKMLQYFCSISRDELLQEQCYDTPRPIGGPLTPSSSASSLTAPESMSLPSSNRSSLLSGPEYDVPKSRPLPVPHHVSSYRSYNSYLWSCTDKYCFLKK